jgi:fatty acid desaturase
VAEPAAPEPLTAGDVLTLPELRHLRHLSGPRSAWLLAHCWATIAGAAALYAAWPSAVTLVLAVALIGSRQLGLLVLLHEGAHWRLFARPAANNRAATWLCAWPLWAELPEYRRRHHLHHRYTQQAQDPDRGLVAALPVARRTLGLDAARDLAGISAWQRARAALREDASAAAAWSRLRGPLAANAMLLAACVVAGQWPLYPLLWLLPQATWLQLLTRIRSLAEHGLAAEGDDPLRNTRTVRAGLLARAFLAPYWVNYHLEHHLLTFVPCWKLRAAHALLRDKGYAPRMELAGSYGDVIRRATGRAPAAPGPSRAAR